MGTASPSLFAGFITNLGQKNKIDHVTGLFNKLKFEEDIESMLEKRPEHPLHLLVLGLDGFKHINELYGKSFGDEILRVIGQRIQGMLPLSASVYRLDGDEFGITVSGERFEMMELYRSLSESFRSQQEYDGKKYFCTISAGSASYPEDASGYTELSEYASHSLKYAKSSAETGSSFSAAPSSNRKCVRWSWWNCCARASSGSSKGLSLSISRR